MAQENSPKLLQHLWAFWQHFSIHKRKSDLSGKQMISAFSAQCPYPVWHNDEWIEGANPPGASYKSDQDFWGQIWELFSQCPIAHNISIWNENSEYADDCWYSKNCYLCHSLYKCEDVRYCFRVVGLQDCQFSVFSFDSQRCIDLIYAFDCYNVKFAIDSKRCRNSAFLFDCQDCEDCLLCWNLRNKRYCIGNKQFSQEEYEKELSKYRLASRKTYATLKDQFSGYIKQHAWWKAVHFDNAENSVGDYINNSKNCRNCFMMEDAEDCENGARAHGAKSSKDFLSVFSSEKVNCSVLAQENCFDIRYCANVMRSKSLKYCINCLECENCFLCAGLVGKKYHILNREYTEETYESLKNTIIEDMKTQWVYWKFFPAYFSPTSYNESVSGIYIPLDIEEQEKEWFRVIQEDYGSVGDYKSTFDLPDSIRDTPDNIMEWWYWDEVSKRPFQILREDVKFYQEIGTPLNDRFYIRRLKENFAWMFPSFETRKTVCVKSGKEIRTTLPQELDGRILSPEEYEKVIY